MLDDSRPLSWQELDSEGKVIACRQALMHVESAREIAMWLSALLECKVTRNAVIGCCDRAGIKLCGTNRKAKKAPRKRRPKLVKHVKPVLSRLPAPPVAVRPSTPPIPFDSVGAHQCRYPLWDDSVSAEDRTVCGAPGYPWCADHREIVFQPPKSKDEKRRAARGFRNTRHGPAKDDDRLMKTSVWTS